MPKYQATSYIRLSYTDDRSSESDSVTNQRKLIENFIERNPDIEIISEKIDDGYSGIIFDRPAFKEMMQDSIFGGLQLRWRDPGYYDAQDGRPGGASAPAAAGQSHSGPAAHRKVGGGGQGDRPGYGGQRLSGQTLFHR